MDGQQQDSVVDPLVGKRLRGNFQLEERMGEGAAGRVYRATQLSLRKQVAVKVLHPHLTTHPMFVERFKREAYAASRLSHPNSVQIIEFGRDAMLGVFFLAMELLKGKELGDIMSSDGPLPMARIVRVMTQVLGALDEAHLAGIVHRDLKPENVMVIDRRDETDFVKVCDFGIAQVIDPLAAERPGGRDRLTATGVVTGTPQYMSPEQVRGEKVDARTDIYAAGIMMYEMLTGVCPFDAPQPIAVVTMHLNDAPVPPSSLRADLDVDPAFEEVILRALSKNPADRQQTAAELRNELEAVLEIIEGEGAIGRAVARVIEPRPSRPSLHPPPPAGSTPSFSKNAGTLDGAPLPAGATGASSGAVPATTSGAVSGALAQVPRWVVPAGIGGGVVVLAVVLGATLFGRRAPTPSPVAAPPERAIALPPIASSAVAPVVAVLPPAPPAATPAGSVEVPAEPRGPGKAAHRRPPTHPAAAAPASASLPHAPAEHPAGPPHPATASNDPASQAHEQFLAGNYRGAIPLFEQAIAHSPHNASLYKSLGQCYSRLGDRPHMISNMRRYLELAPNAPDAPAFRAMIGGGGTP